MIKIKKHQIEDYISDATEIAKQNTLVSTVNIKSINGNSILGSGDLTMSGGGGSGANLTTTQTINNFTINSDTGTDATVPLGNGSLAGATLNDYTTAEKNKLAGIETGATVGVPYTGATTNVNLGEFGLTSGQVTLDTTPTGTAVVGTTQWNDALGSSQTTLKGGNVVLKNGVDLVARIVNKVTPNQTLTKAAYQAVRVSGATGQRLSVELAQGDADLNSADTIGLVSETIATNQEGFIITMGQIEEINTTGSLQSETWADGDVLYLSPTVAGRLTNIKPTGATGHIVVIGYVEYAHAVHGKIYVKIMNGWELDELHNVYINNPLNNEGLFYETSTQLWKTASIATALGYTPANNSSVVHLTGAETIAGVKTFSSNPKIPVNGGNSGIGALVIDNGTGQIEIATNYLYPNLVEIQYVKGVTSSIQTQISGKQDKSLAAYSVIANNTNATANGTAQVFKDIAEQTNLASVSTISWNGTAPTNPISLNYKWEQIGSLVTVRFNLVYTTAGTSNTTLTITLPTDMPTPATVSGFTSASDVICYGAGQFGGGKTLPAAYSTGAVLRRNATTGTNYEFVLARSTANASAAWLIIQYFA